MIENNDKTCKHSTDTEILEKIRSLLSENPAIDDSKIKVEVKDGMVVLKGKADTEAEKENAQLICASVYGVIKVDNHLSVSAGIAHALTVLVSKLSAEENPEENPDKK